MHVFKTVTQANPCLSASNWRACRHLTSHHAEPAYHAVPYGSPSGLISVARGGVGAELVHDGS